MNRCRRCLRFSMWFLLVCSLSGWVISLESGVKYVGFIQASLNGQELQFSLGGSISLESGELQYERISDFVDPSIEPDFYGWHTFRLEPDYHFHLPYLRHYRPGACPAALPGLYAGLPLWVPALISIGVLVLTRRKRALHDASLNYCKSCGYDLTGNVSGACSECGANFPDHRIFTSKL